MLNNYCRNHHKEIIKYCQIHKKYLCIDCSCESISCFTQIIDIKNNDNNNNYNTNNDNKNRKKENNNKNNNNLNLESFSNAENKFKIIENKINSFFEHVLQLKEILENYINDNKKSIKNINNLIKQEKKRKKKNFNFMKNYKLKDIDDIINKVDFFINETVSIISINLTKKFLNHINIIEKINNDNNKNKKNSNNINNINNINNVNYNIIKTDNENINSINENLFNNDIKNEIYNSEKVLMESNYSSQDNYFEKGTNNNNKIVSEMNRIDSKQDEVKITTIILFKKKYITYTKNNSDIINFELLTNGLKSFSKEIIIFPTSQKSINYIKELNNSILLSASNDKTVKIFSIDFNKKNPGQLLIEINIKKILIKVLETSKFLYLLINNNNKSKDPILNIYNYDINNKNKKLQESKVIYDKSTPNDIIYFKSDKFGLEEEDIEEIIISFAKEEKLIFYNLKKNFNNKIIKDIKCSKKKDTMLIYNDLLIIGGQNVFYFIDLYKKKIISKKNETIIVHSLNIIDNIIFAGGQNGKLRVFKITNENNLELITQKKLDNNTIVNCILCNEDKKLIYVHYYPFINIMNYNISEQKK